jgi:hypothetical protein
MTSDQGRALEARGHARRHTDQGPSRLDLHRAELFDHPPDLMVNTSAYIIIPNVGEQSLTAANALTKQNQSIIGDT